MHSKTVGIPHGAVLFTFLFIFDADTSQRKRPQNGIRPSRACNVT